MRQAPAKLAVLATVLLQTQTQCFQQPTPNVRRPLAVNVRRPPAVGTQRRRRTSTFEPLSAAPIDAAEALVAFINAANPLHDALTAIGTQYIEALNEAPMATKCVTNALVGVTGDAIAQRDQVYDSKRAMRYALKGIGGGMLWVQYFDFADACAVHAVDEAWARVAVQMALEQFLWVPWYVAFYDLPVASLGNGVPVQRVPNVVREMFAPTVVTSAKLWTPANLLVYSAPREYRLLVSNVFDLAWNAINSDISASCSEECPVGDGPPGASRMCPPETATR